MTFEKGQKVWINGILCRIHADSELDDYVWIESVHGYGICHVHRCDLDPVVPGQEVYEDHFTPCEPAFKKWLPKKVWSKDE